MKRLFMLLCAVVAFAACEQAPIKEMQGAAINERNLEVSFEGADDTRIQLQGGKTVWTEGDHVSVFYRSTVNEEWQFDGKTGDRIGNIVPVDNTLNPPATHNRVVVIYPYNNEYYLNTETYSIEASLPAVQNYLKDSYGTNGNIMVSSGDYKQVSLKSVCGWLKLQLTGDGEVVKSITLRGNNGEQVAGLVYVDATTAEATLATAKHNSDDNSQLDGTLVLDDSIYTEVTLDCGEGVALGKEATAFYIALPPQTFTQGFTVEIEDTEGYVMEQSTDKALIIERNHIQPMAAFEFINPNPPTQPTPASNEIWYTATAKVEPTYDDAPTFGAFVVSNVWDSETKRGIITFDGDVTMIGDDAFYNCDKLTGVALPDSVTSIGEKAFYDCGGLIEFTIPDSVTSIGNYALYSCTSLTSVTIGDSVTTIEYGAFYSCNSLTSITIPDSVTSIGDFAFSDCDSLTSVTIPDSVTSIGYSAFRDCNSLQEFKGMYASEDGRCLITYGVLNSFAPNGLTEYSIPDGVTVIGDDAFRSCDCLTSVTIPDSVTTIGGYAFCDCTSLKQVYCYAAIPPSLGYDVFFCNYSLKRIYVYEECVELYKSAWSSYKDRIYTNGTNYPNTTTIAYITNNGNAITPTELPIISNIYENGVGTLVFSGKEIPGSAFSDCTNLTSVTIPDSVTSIGDYAFYNCESLTSVTMPDSVTTIGEGVFYNCTSLTSVTIPDNVTTIGDYAFDSCTSLTEFNGKFAEDNGRILVVDGTLIAFAPAGISEYNIPDSVTSIGNYAFADCTSLTSVNIPDSVTTIRDGAFYYCIRLTSVYCKATTPPALGETSVFSYNGSGRKIYVPAGSVETYKSATNWSKYASAIVGYDF